MSIDPSMYQTIAADPKAPAERVQTWIARPEDGNRGKAPPMQPFGDERPYGGPASWSYHSSFLDRWGN